jgi:F0F1-type ATP synthase gamma subunit
MNKARPIKYIRKVSDGKGGYRYYYKESDNRKPRRIDEATLNEFIKFIRSEKVEHGLCLNDKNEILAYREGERNHIRFIERQVRNMKKAKLFIHNHTNGTSFSDDDLKFLILNQIKEIQIFTKKNKTNIVYKLKVKKVIPVDKRIELFVYHKNLIKYAVDAEKESHSIIKDLIKTYGEYLEYARHRE